MYIYIGMYAYTHSVLLFQHMWRLRLHVFCGRRIWRGKDSSLSIYVSKYRSTYKYLLYLRISFVFCSSAYVEAASSRLLSPSNLAREGLSRANVRLTLADPFAAVEGIYIYIYIFICVHIYIYVNM